MPWKPEHPILLVQGDAKAHARNHELMRVTFWPGQEPYASPQADLVEPKKAKREGDDILYYKHDVGFSTRSKLPVPDHAENLASGGSDDFEYTTTSPPQNHVSFSMTIDVRLPSHPLFAAALFGDDSLNAA